MGRRRICARLFMGYYLFYPWRLGKVNCRKGSEVQGRNGFKIGPGRLAWIVGSLLLIGLAWWGVARLDNGLTVRRFYQDGVPLRFIAPQDGKSLPAVIVAHGFSGSQQLMLGYGYALARAGYGAMLLDFAGHGANSQPSSSNGIRLQANLETAHQALIAQPEVDGERVALLGHSMGSGAVMQAGIERPEQAQAVIAVSPTGADVTETVPHNLMLQAGSLEGRFVANARRLLAEAGGPNDDFASGRARTFVEIPGVEHITILFSPTSRSLAIDWLDKSFGLSSDDVYRDTRMLWYGLHLVGWLSLGLALAPLFPGLAAPAPEPRQRWRRWLGLALAPFVAIGFLALLNALIDLSDFLGLLVGGALAIWLLVMGSVWLAVGFRPQLPGGRSLLWGVGLFALLWLAAGLLAQFTWLQWFLIPPRLARWPLLALACVPWKLAAGYAQHRANGWTRAGWWLAQSALVTGGLILTAFLVPGMFILVLIAPALPLVLALEGVAAAAIDDPWAYGFGAALFFGWLMAALFPLA